MSIPVFKPSIRRKDMHSVLQCLVTDEIGPAGLADDLVTKVCQEYGHEGGLALRETVRSLELVIRAMGLSQGDKIVLSPLSPASYTVALQSMGIVPVFVDVNDDNACINIEETGKAVINGASAVFLHVPLGRIPDIQELSALGVPLMVDLGEALGARDTGGLLGSGADYLVIPMESQAIATTGGGTLILARNNKLLTELKNAASSLSPDTMLADINASLAHIQWQEYPQALETRDNIEEYYLQALAQGPHKHLTGSILEDCRPVPYSFPVKLSGSMKDVRAYALRKNVETRPAFFGSMLDTYPGAAENCKNAGRLALSVLLFPLYPTLGKNQIQKIYNVISTLP